jgi:hypothetical protein
VPTICGLCCHVNAANLCLCWLATAANLWLVFARKCTWPANICACKGSRPVRPCVDPLVHLHPCIHLHPSASICIHLHSCIYCTHVSTIKFFSEHPQLLCIAKLPVLRLPCWFWLLLLLLLLCVCGGGGWGGFRAWALLSVGRREPSRVCWRDVAAVSPSRARAAWQVCLLGGGRFHGHRRSDFVYPICGC